jgi:hypothetical protein
MSKQSAETRQKIRELYEENELASVLSLRSRAKSITIGQCGGGLIEIMLRSEFSHLWYVVHPTEAVELIGQLASACGVEIAMRPREDFAAWRSWDASLPGSMQWVGAAPWQLNDEDREKVIAAKEKNIKAIKTVEEKEEPKLLTPTKKRTTKKAKVEKTIETEDES